MFVKPITQCPQILLPYSYQVKFFNAISFLRHFRSGKPSSNFNFAQTYTVITWNSCLSLHIICLAQMGLCLKPNLKLIEG